MALIKRAGVEIGDSIARREYFIGLTFRTESEIENKEFENIKAEDQLIDVVE